MLLFNMKDISMKKIVLAFLVSFSLVTGANASASELGLGYAKGDTVDNVTFFAGLNVLSNIGIRLEYTKNITDDIEFSKKDVTRFGLFATYTLPLIGGISVTPKAGLVKTDGSFEFLEAVEAISGSSTDFSYGLEVNYDFNDNISFFVGYTDYTGELDIQSVNKGNIDQDNVTFGIKISL
jgi:hypothetical protein